MPSMNIDELAGKIFKPISITLDGKEYTIVSMPSDAFDGMNPETMNINSARKALAGMLSVEEKVFKKTDFRLISVAAGYIMKQARKQIEAYVSKNDPGEDVVQSP